MLAACAWHYPQSSPGRSTNNSVEAGTRTAGKLRFPSILVPGAILTFHMVDSGRTHSSAGDLHLMALVNGLSEYPEMMPCVAVLGHYRLSRGAA